ncbi:MAG: hypothetical protein NWQ54_02165 [Paraglaciecola sp.]|uniref:hypothetical protein n=1 Tax=Pseudomonadati TaxID=3379134 RepID=UPI00273EFF29|nr:hypothetical protein [Paraglaciecola sp.]MDP5030581.1 hypothetical protein [Paraglaciecola sp.]MDP5129658.1 hypothetical protein [Paraglaciecola sp.]
MKCYLLCLSILVVANSVMGQEQQVIQLEDTIRGDQEQPKVLTIVPWQAPTIKQALPSPIVERINRKFVPLERDEFSRQLKALSQQQNLSYPSESLNP